MLFDRSWYNRAGVERVMELATEDEVEPFLRDVPESERMLVRSGITLVKYWLSISDQEQRLRFLMRIHAPLKQWKLSPMDLESRVRWKDYTRAKEERCSPAPPVPRRPGTSWSPTTRSARLNCIDHLLSLLPCEEVPHEEITLPERVYHKDYERRDLPPRMFVPRKY